MRPAFLGKQPRMSDSVMLPITPMASIFTVILVILLKSFSQGVTNFTPSETMTLPELVQGTEVPDGLKIEVSENGITVGDRRVLRLTKFQIAVTEGRPLAPVAEALKIEAAGRKGTATTRAVVLADEHAPYDLMRRVLSTALAAGFRDLKLMVVTK